MIKQLKEIRIQQRKKQYEVSDYLGIGRDMLSRYESGKREMPMRLLFKYADYLGYELRLILKNN